MNHHNSIFWSSPLQVWTATQMHILMMMMRRRNHVSCMRIGDNEGNLMVNQSGKFWRFASDQHPSGEPIRETLKASVYKQYLTVEQTVTGSGAGTQKTNLNAPTTQKRKRRGTRTQTHWWANHSEPQTQNTRNAEKSGGDVKCIARSEDGAENTLGMFFRPNFDIYRLNFRGILYSIAFHTLRR